jgi:alpha-tubulin suppressor-like RCC1 family protein
MMKTCLNTSGLGLALVLAWTNGSFAQAPALTARLPVAPLSQSSFVLDASGALFGWEDNQSGQLGIGPQSTYPYAVEPIPVAIPFPSGVKRWIEAASGSWHTLAIGDDGKIYACGANNYKQLGTEDPGNKLTFTWVPLPTGISNWIAVAAGDHSLALTADGRLFGWGANYNGQLGIGNRDNQSTAQLLPYPQGVNRWTAMAAGESHTLVIGDNGLIYACGANYYGTLGNGNNDAQTWLQPVMLPTGVTAWRSVAADFNSSYALGNNGSIYAWGRNSEGQLGNGSTAHTNIPVRVATPVELTSWNKIVAGGGQGFALATDGTLYAWGENFWGECGLGVRGPQLLPRTVPFPEGSPGWADISGGRGHTLALSADCRIYQWGLRGFATNPETAPNLLSGFETFCNPPSNMPPIVILLNPTNRASIPGPAPILLEAVANDPDGNVTRVDFYANDQWLGEGTRTGSNYAYTWSNAPPGLLVLTARATDNLGLGVASTPITVAVLDTNLNTVQIQVVDDSASEIGPHSGFCRITRTGSTEASLRVDFAIGGTANVLDYVGINYIYYSNYVVMLPGMAGAEIGIRPLPDRLVEGNKTVIFTLLNRLNYCVGFSNQATLTITDDPAASHYGELYVDLVRPSQNQTIVNTTPIDLSAMIYGPILLPTVVEFFDGPDRLGARTNNTSQPDMNLFEMVWLNPPVGTHVLTATTLGTNGIMVSSLPVTIQVIAPTDVPNVGIGGPSPTNQTAQVLVQGQPNGIYAVQYSMDLVNWKFLSTGYCSNGVVQFIDAVAPDSPQRFYRAVIMP